MTDLKITDTTARHEIIEFGYGWNIPIKQISAVTGLTPGSVKVIAHRLGCSKRGTKAMDYRRGFSIPAAVAKDYRDLVHRFKYTSREAAAVLGIIPKGVAA